MERARCFLVPRFFDEADAMRAAFDRLVGDPYNQDMDRDGVWNYWYVPDLYTYFRAMPERVVPADVLLRFRERLASWARETLGFTHVSSQTFCMYIDGCELQLHNDASHGDFAFVYSLTHWDARKFEGGETIIFGDKTVGVRGRANAGAGLYEKVPASYNQMLVFDDRLVHGVARVTGGGMSPLDSRVVVTGHLSAREIVVETADGSEDARLAFAESAEGLFARLSELSRGAAEQGFFTARATIGPDGDLRALTPLLFRVTDSEGVLLPSEPYVEAFEALLRAQRFPRSKRGATLTIPVAFKNDDLAAAAPVPEKRVVTLLAEREAPRTLDRLLAPIARRNPRIAEEIRVLSVMPPQTRRVPIVKQREWVEGGAACLAMVLLHHGRPTSLDEACKACGVTAFDATSAKDIVVAARSFGFQTRARRLADPEHLASCNAPAILHWEESRFVVLERWSRRGAVIVDPRVGRRFVAPNVFRQSFSGVCIELTKA